MTSLSPLFLSEINADRNSVNSINPQVTERAPQLRIVYTLLIMTVNRMA